MALTTSQLADILFKKYITGKSATLSPEQSGTPRQYFEEPKTSRAHVLPSDIWTQADLLPTYAATVSNVLIQVRVTMSHISGSNNLSYDDPTGVLKDIVPFSFNYSPTNSSYGYQLYKNDGTTPIPLGGADWLFDNNAGVLTFFDETLVSNYVSAAAPPIIQCWKYIGTKGLGAASGGGSAEWIDSVITITDTPPISPATSSRYLVASTGATQAFTGKENQIAYYNGTSWEFTSDPSQPDLYAGTHLTVDSDQYAVYLYTGSNWVRQPFDSVEVDIDSGLTASVTTGDNATASIYPITYTPVGDVRVYINGSLQKVGYSITGCDCYFGTQSSTARAKGEIQAGDYLYWNGSNNFDLATTDKISFEYSTYYNVII